VGADGGKSTGQCTAHAKRGTLGGEIGVSTVSWLSNVEGGGRQKEKGAITRKSRQKEGKRGMAEFNKIL